MKFLLRVFFVVALTAYTAQAVEIKPSEKIEKKADKNEKVDADDKPTAKPMPEMSMGSKKAPVVIVEYSSLTCNHCAEFHTDILPKIDEKYIKPGLVRFIFRDYPSDQISLVAHQLAWCRGELKYLDFLKVLYSKQKDWLLSADPEAELKKIALKNGITNQQYESCYKNQILLDRIVQGRLEGMKKYNITVTPTLVINAKVYQHALSFEEFEKIVKPLIEAKTKTKGKKNSLVNMKEKLQITKVKTEGKDKGNVSK